MEKPEVIQNENAKLMLEILKLHAEILKNLSEPIWYLPFDSEKK